MRQVVSLLPIRALVVSHFFFIVCLYNKCLFYLLIIGPICGNTKITLSVSQLHVSIVALTFLRKLWLVLQGPRLVQVICFLNEDCTASNGEGKQIVANTHVKSRTLALKPLIS